MVHLLNKAGQQDDSLQTDAVALNLYHNLTKKDNGVWSMFAVYIAHPLRSSTSRNLS